MGGLFGGSGNAMETPKLTGIQIQTASYGACVPLVYGTNRISANVIWHDDFTAIEINNQVGGKGGEPTEVKQYKYTASVILAICEGAISAINRVWREKTIKTISNLGFTLFLGTRPQTAWSYLTSKYPSKAVGYSGTCYVAKSDLSLGRSGTLKNYSFEVRGLALPLISDPAYPNAHASDVIVDFLTNSFYGAGWSASRIASLTNYKTYCQAAGFFVSPVFKDRKPALDYLRELLKSTNSNAVWSEGVLKIIPYGDVEITGNSVTYTPNTTPVYDLTESNFIPFDDSLIKIRRGSLADSFNSIPVEFDDASQDYNSNLVEDPDPVDIEAFGLRKGPNETLLGITSQQAAVQISRILAQRSLYCRNTYTFKLPWNYIALEPMDLVTLTDVALGLDHKVVRIKSITEDPDGVLEFEAEEWPFGTATAAKYTTQTTDGTIPEVETDPGNANTPVIFDVPTLLLNGVDPEIIIATSSTNPLWGGCEIWVSEDNSTFGYVGNIEPKSRHGVLTATFPSGSSLDTVNTLSLDLSTSLGSLLSVTDQNRDDLLTLSYVDGEFISFKTATLTSAYNYNVTSIRRGLYGSSISSHSSGTKFVRLDDGVFRLAIPKARIGSTLYIKLRSFNIWGGGLQDLSSISSHSFVPSIVSSNPPYPDSCTTTVSSTIPGTGSNQRRHKFDEENDGVDNNSGTPRSKKAKYVTVDWTYTLPNPSTLLTGFRVVVHTGTDPNDQGSWLKSEMIVGSSVRKAVFTLPAKTSTTVNASVQALYGRIESSWRLSTGSVVVDPDTISIAIQDLTNSPDGAVGSRLNANPNLDNLVPNPNGELGSDATGKDPEGNLLVNDNTNAFAGNYVRRLGQGSTGAVESYLTRKIPCVEGDIFTLSLKAKRTTGSTAMVVALRWADSNGTYGSTQDTVSFNPGDTAYADVTLTATCPSGKTGVWLHVSRIADGSSSTFYLDNLSLRRAVKTGHMDPESGFRLRNALANSGTTINDRVWYRGNNQSGTLGGAPNISALTVTRKRWGPGDHVGILSFKLQPTADTDNLDAMRYAKVVWYKQSGTGGTSGTLTLLQTLYYPLPDRLYRTPGTDNSSNNAAFAFAMINNANLDGGVPAAAITIYNAFGASDTHCFYSASSSADEDNLVDNGTSWPAGLTGGTGGGSGGGSGGGGNCISPDTEILLRDGIIKRAGMLVVGDIVLTMHENCEKVIDMYKISHVSIHESERLSISLTDGRKIIVSPNHQFCVGENHWKSAKYLKVNDTILGTIPGTVQCVSITKNGPVVRITVDDAHTYIANGLLCHNMKPPEI